ncbi:hypothetical protein PVK06_024053 [Gossypium arboreum]|uniref:Uncharacterized protein n=1 Tax=Gossypium arboreum TaxID=29729 RepID=A0ABR0PCR6_GOSAR|nr:hypothetical protein PVK06_024053 [Gossypium arboreum]
MLVNFGSLQALHRILWVSRCVVLDRGLEFLKKFGIGLESSLVDDGTLVCEDEGLCDIATTYFKYLFMSQELEDPRCILERVVPCVTDVMNASLLAPYTYDNIQEALKVMAPTKALGLDGLPALFY